MSGLVQGVDSQSQTYLDMWGGAEDKDDSLGHVFRFETLRAGDEDRMDPSSLPPLKSSPASTFPPQPSRRGAGLARKVECEGWGSLPSAFT